MQVTDEMVIKALSAWFNEPIDDPYPEHVDNMKAAIEAAIHWKQRALKAEEDDGENIKTLLLNIGANQMTAQYKWLPSEPTDEMVNAMWFNGCQVTDKRLLLAYKAMWRAAPEVEQEPAVYLVWHNGGFTYTKHPEEITDAYEILPLYTHQQPKQYVGDKTYKCEVVK